MELPVSKVKRIAKFDPDVKLISNEGAVALTLSCEMFIKLLAERVYQYTRLGKKKTIQIRDFDACLQNTPAFSFLEGALETWTDVAGDPGSKSRKSALKTKTGGSDCDDHEDCARGANESMRETPPSGSSPNADSISSPATAKRQRLLTDGSSETHPNSENSTV